ncbi:MAG: hypothetical protein HON42_03365 [Alphaproteobacteria bacterium]|jgi:hypothetical protein|nr:hypothetical protein [Alphaproteobacteria bacterium]MBT5828527.1 hypothetical protein [Alphaproteobacteria bacterium]
MRTLIQGAVGLFIGVSSYKAYKLYQDYLCYKDDPNDAQEFTQLVKELVGFELGLKEQDIMFENGKINVKTISILQDKQIDELCKNIRFNIGKNELAIHKVEKAVIQANKGLTGADLSKVGSNAAKALLNIKNNIKKYQELNLILERRKSKPSKISKEIATTERNSSDLIKAKSSITEQQNKQDQQKRADIIAAELLAKEDALAAKVKFSQRAKQNRAQKTSSVKLKAKEKLMQEQKRESLSKVNQLAAQISAETILGVDGKITQIISMRKEKYRALEHKYNQLLSGLSLLSANLEFTQKGIYSTLNYLESLKSSFTLALDNGTVADATESKFGRNPDAKEFYSLEARIDALIEQKKSYSKPLGAFKLDDDAIYSKKLSDSKLIEKLQLDYNDSVKLQERIGCKLELIKSELNKDGMSSMKNGKITEVLMKAIQGDTQDFVNILKRISKSTSELHEGDAKFAELDGACKAGFAL